LQEAHRLESEEAIDDERGRPGRRTQIRQSSACRALGLSTNTPVLTHDMPASFNDFA
jgi:hypothetical protein